MVRCREIRASDGERVVELLARGFHHYRRFQDFTARACSRFAKKLPPNLEGDIVIRGTVYEQIRSVSVQQNRVLPRLDDDVGLMESGLDSLCIAILIANLDDKLNLDPFGSGDEVEIPVTIGDLVRVYEAAAAHAA
jgi:hypothetical protein